MRARRSSIPLPMRRRGRPGPPRVARPHLDPRSRSRRRAAVSGCGGTAFRPCAAGAATASRAARRGRPRSGAAVPKAGRGLSRLSGPSLKARARGRSPALRGRPGRAPTVLRFLSGPLGVSRDEGTSTATRTSPAREFLTLAFPVFRAHARAGEGSQGPSGPATRPREAWFSPAVEQRCSERTARVRPREGGGLTKRQATTTPLRSPFLEPSPFVHRTPYMPATVRR